MTTLINADTSGGLKLTSDTSGALDIQSAGSTKLAMDSSGNVDIVGTVTGAAFEPDGDTAAGDNAAIGYTAAEGLILTGQGSTSDITFKNDADATVMSIPTGTTNVGIGTTAPGAALDVVGGIKLSGQLLAGASGSVYAPIISAAYVSGTSNLFMRNLSGTNRIDSYNDPISATYPLQINASIYTFYVADTERMRIDGSGNLLIACTSLDGNASTGTRITVDGSIFATRSSEYAAILRRSNSDGGVILFRRDSSNVGSVSVNGSSTAYNTSSDYRLKENVDYSWDATTRLKQLKPARFNFIADADRTVDGFLAHEVSSVVPEAITGEKDGTKTHTKVVLDAAGALLSENIEQSDWVAGKSSTTDSDGNTVPAIYPSDSTWEASKVMPDYQGIDQSKLVPLLVKTIQELEARITALEA
jgi:hypothetical protein